MSGELPTFTQSWNQTISTTPRCVGLDNYSAAIVELTFSSITLPIHLFVVIAMIAYRDLMKRNVVNLYAGNVVFSGLVGDIWRMYINIEDLSHTHRVKFVERQPDMSDWREFQLGFNVALTLVTSGSVGLVINAMRSIQFRVHKTVGGVSNLATEVCEEKEECSRWERFRRSQNYHPKSWAAFYIFCVWALPIIVTALTAVHGQCDYRCHCAGLTVPYPTPYDGLNCVEVSEDICSNLMPPLSKLTLNVSFGVWIFYWIILTVSLIKTQMDLRKIRKQRIQSMRLLSDRRAEAEEQKNSKSTKETPNEVLSNADETKEQGERKNKRSIAVKLDPSQSASTRISGSIFIRSLRKNFKLLVIMYMSYFIGSAPVLVVILIDGSTGNFAISPNSAGMIIIFTLPLIAAVICTIMVCMYLSGIKTAVRSLVVAIVRCFQ